jgi:hypothetical protein
VKNAVNPADDDDEHESSRRSQLGVVIWSASEKDAFFNALARKGKDAVPEIADLVGTKSRLEVQEYIRVLHRNLELYHTTERNPRTVSLAEIPAAFEIGAELGEFLDGIADGAGLRDEQNHNAIGKRKHGDMWLIDSDVAGYVEESLESGEHDAETNHDIFATARLLRLSSWIELSEDIFMNAGGSRIDENWRNICFEDESPSITCDAFSEFYTLAVSLTRRLVQSSIFFALSRIRSLGHRWSVEPFVRIQDVEAALDVLKMKRNTHEFWIGAARRCGIDVKTQVTRGKSRMGFISHNEVERRLSLRGRVLSGSNPESREDTSPPPPDNSDSNDSDSGTSPSTSDEDMSTDDNSMPLDDDDLSDPEELYASRLDRKADQEEELRIWEALDQQPPTASLNAKTDPDTESGIKAESDDEKPLREPLAKRKQREELVDWRDRTLYRSEWESRVQEEEDEVGNPAKRQKLDTTDI